MSENKQDQSFLVKVINNELFLPMAGLFSIPVVWLLFGFLNAVLFVVVGGLILFCFIRIVDFFSA